jgi:pimeloyl-ACP methyl ester carboxylesterase
MAIFRHEALSLHYLQRGSGEPLMLIHGLGASGADWALQVRALEGRFRLVIPDLPGCGHSGALPANCSIAQFANALWALLDRLDAPRSNLIGFSLGGAVALEMALQRPDAVPRLVLINSLATYRIDHWRKWLEARVPSLCISVLGMRALGALCAVRMFPHPWQMHLRRRAAQVIATVPKASYLGIIRALEQWSAVGRLERLTAKIWMIAAEHDYTPLAEKHATARAHPRLRTRRRHRPGRLRVVPVADALPAAGAWGCHGRRADPPHRPASAAATRHRPGLSGHHRPAGARRSAGGPRVCRRALGGALFRRNGRCDHGGTDAAAAG